MKKKCLVKKAMDECQCEDCVNLRKFKASLIKWHIENELMKIVFDAVKDSKEEKPRDSFKGSGELMEYINKKILPNIDKFLEKQ